MPSPLSSSVKSVYDGIFLWALFEMNGTGCHVSLITIVEPEDEGQNISLITTPSLCL
jgi:hypothetical protein